MKACFRSADILLPGKGTAIDKWAVIACDQYTSQPEYWENVENYVGDAPSTFRMIYPEVYLEEKDGDNRIHNIQTCMQEYRQTGILEPAVQQGFVLVERKLNCGIRKGLVGCVDLEAYSFVASEQSLIRATEQTIESRIPPRVRIRQGATIESPHIMLLIDDADKTLIEPLYENRHKLPVVYDTELMLGGGHLTGYAIAGKAAAGLDEQLLKMQEQSGGLFLAVGDGNHSLATAKTCWEQLKATLTAEEKQTHPARYALVELVNLHDESLAFEPIHRVLFQVRADELIEGFKEALCKQQITYEAGEDIVFKAQNMECGIRIVEAGGRLPVEILQQYLDQYLREHTETKIDYVHGMEAVDEIAAQLGNCGISLPSIQKNSLFPAIKAGGVLPRKTFSMGEAFEKRYYMECRRVTK